MATVEFSRMSPDMEQGFPGNLDMTVSYSLTEEGEVVIEYFADCDQDTICNLTNHSYFNLSGEQADTILDHVLMLKSDAFTPTDGGLIPTGEIRDVTGTPMDFRVAKPIGQDIDSDYEQMIFGGGYDHNFVIDGYKGDGSLLTAGEEYDPASGRVMEVLTTVPGIQFYTANGMVAEGGKKGRTYGPRSAYALETQFFPDNVHHDNFPKAIFGPGRDYVQTTVYRFPACR